MSSHKCSESHTAEVELGLEEALELGGVLGLEDVLELGEVLGFEEALGPLGDGDRLVLDDGLELCEAWRGTQV